jgi:3-oxoacyl-[acyl-carrier-protein] synthase III
LNIESLAVALPTQRVTNDELIALVRSANTEVDDRIVETYCRTLGTFLQRSGARTRAYRNRQTGETAIDFITAAVSRALQEAGVTGAEIDLVIYCGVGRGFLEPANATFVARACRLDCDAFDISDACMSWVRALHIAYSLLLSGTYTRILVVNGEFTVYEHGLPEVLKIRSPDQLRHVFPAFTIGEAATATVLTRSTKLWRFTFRSRPDLADLCSLPLPGYRDFSGPDVNARIGLSGIHQLVSFGQELGENGIRELTSLLRDSIPDFGAIELFFPHGATQQWCREGTQRLGLSPRVVCNVFPEAGNLISASIPVALRRAADDGRLRRGQRIVLCPASAGMSFAVVEFEY